MSWSELPEKARLQLPNSEDSQADNSERKAAPDFYHSAELSESPAGSGLCDIFNAEGLEPMT
jgi:hypothetical protein